MVNISLARRMNLKPADVIVIPKVLGAVEHYIVYLGVNDWGEEIYIENAPDKGVQLLNGNQLVEQNKDSYVSRYRAFSGNDYERNLAVQRALSLLSAEYHLFRFNCENFANYVQKGVSFSEQVSNASAIVAFASLIYLGNEAYKASNRW